MSSGDIAFTPGDFGFPPKFTEYRKRQFDLAVELASSNKRFRGLSAATGTGKSLLYMTAAQLIGGRTLVLVGTKMLQDQLIEDFASVGMVDMRGAGNYPCVALHIGGHFHGYAPRGTSCADAPCKAGMACSLRDQGCVHYDQQRLSASSEMVVANYSYWLAMARHGNPVSLGEFNLIILDEAHTAPRWLAANATSELSRARVSDLLDLELPPLDEGIPVWATWAKDALGVARGYHSELKRDIEDEPTGPGRAQLLRQMLAYTRLMGDLEIVSSAHAWHNAESPRRSVKMPGLQIDWVTQETETGAKFEPTWAHPYAEEWLFRHIPNVILASATLTTDISRYLGIDIDDFSWHEAAQGFSPRRRPLIYWPTCRVDRNMSGVDWWKLVKRIDRIIEGRLDRKGIIHTVSYSRARELMAQSKYAHLMITHDSRSMRSQVEAFKRAKAPAILVSPSVVEGHDFPGDQCEYQIVMKVPFTDGRDPVEKARRRSDKYWPTYNAAQTMIQMVGRGMRKPTDICETWILDSHWGWFRWAAHWPQWFKDAFREVTDVTVALDRNMTNGLGLGRR